MSMTDETQITEEAGPTQDKPRPVLEGSFAVFTPPDGNVLLAWKKRGTTETKHLVIPAFIIQMAAQASGGQYGDVISAISSGNV